MARLFYYLNAIVVVLVHSTFAKPYDGQTGSKKVNILSDNCWKNLTLQVPPSSSALIVTTSYGEKLSNGKPTGLCLQELADPYYVYLDAGFGRIDITSIKGGKVPYDTQPNTGAVKRFLKDKEAVQKLATSIPINETDFSSYDVVFMAGGWGAAFDLGYSEELGERVASALEQRTPMIASTCHGALGFAQANRSSDGEPWVKGLKMTGVTDAQIKHLGITETPLHPETVLKELGADFQCIHGTSFIFGDVSATSVSVDDSGPIIVTGQNQCGSCVVAQRQVHFFLSGSSI